MAVQGRRQRTPGWRAAALICNFSWQNIARGEGSGRRVPERDGRERRQVTSVEINVAKSNDTVHAFRPAPVKVKATQNPRPRRTTRPLKCSHPSHGLMNDLSNPPPRLRENCHFATVVGSTKSSSTDFVMIWLEGPLGQADPHHTRTQTSWVCHPQQEPR